MGSRVDRCRNRSASRGKDCTPERAKLDEREQGILRKALADTAGRRCQAARELGIARTTLSHRLEALGIRAARRSEPTK